MVMELTPGPVPIVPDLPPAVSVPLVSLKALYFACGTMPIENEGRSEIHSALSSLQVASAQVFVTEKLLAVCVASVSLSA